MQESWLEIRRGHIGIERIDRALQIAVAEANDVLIDAARRQREHPSFGRREKVRDKVADLHDREVMTRRVETERVKIVNVVVRLAARREDRPNSAGRDDRVTDRRVFDVRCEALLIDLRGKEAAYPDLTSRTSYAFTHRVGLYVHEQNLNGLLVHSARCDGTNAPFARCHAARHRGRIHDARPDGGRLSRCEVRIGEKAFQHERDVARAAGRRVIA